MRLGESFTLQAAFPAASSRNRVAKKSCEVNYSELITKNACKKQILSSQLIKFHLNLMI
jgi:hypothetical protein